MKLVSFYRLYRLLYTECVIFIVSARICAGGAWKHVMHGRPQLSGEAECVENVECKCSSSSYLLIYNPIFTGKMHGTLK
jgi:hypothetical protein